ncbi:hypothetical protein Rhsp01_34410 [Rhizobium sp. NBRC 114257]|uniref:Uncharacterized protein n=1 Tax=Rhizobium dioscoreae TaxID=2653122 RepID=A0ABQ0Z3C5_9HYPH|nr:hypothetical protein RsS93_25890 [Rhizobium dioscoreae]GLU82265.1 hypothetical protein Rhsp01_34410 [Rhizobium sp. NBRC 114257]
MEVATGQGVSRVVVDWPAFQERTCGMYQPRIRPLKIERGVRYRRQLSRHQIEAPGKDQDGRTVRKLLNEPATVFILLGLDPMNDRALFEKCPAFQIASVEKERCSLRMNGKRL